ncbi:MAG TPA: hypothetical protein V6C88_15830 [Chroococcidiopsis sp.]
MAFDGAELVALVESIVIEALVVGIWGKLQQKDWRSLVAVAAAATLITHPILWVWFTELPPEINFWQRSLLLESVGVVTEGALYRWIISYLWLCSCSWSWCMGLSFWANLASYSVGLLISGLPDWG